VKAAMLEGKNNLVVRDVETPKCPPHGLLLKVKACGLCGSDIRKIRNGSSNFKYPVLLGHEVVGTVVEADMNTRDFKVGDRLCIGSIIPCGECYFCKKGIDNLCQNAIYHSLGLYDDYQGGYAEYVALNENMVNKGPIVKIPDEISYIEAAMVEPLTDVLNSHELIKLKEGDIAVVVGAGPIGAMHVSLLKLNGIGTTILSDISAERLSLAKKACNPEITVDSSKESLKDVIMKVTSGRGADVVIIACSVKKAQEESLEIVRAGGDVILFGGLKEGESMIGLDSNVIHYKQISIHGTTGSRKKHFQEIMDAIQDKKIDVSNYATEMPLKDINKAIELAEQGKVLKAVLIP
jgi:L-iditol 2-dehydrogenase